MKQCPCGTGREYSACCHQYISGSAKAPTAEALMRSRYSAYAEHEIDYILRTCVHHKEEKIDYESTRDWSEKSKWLGLKIISTEKGGISDSEGTVEFEAVYERKGLKDIHHEVAKFKRGKGSEEGITSGVKGEWLYEDGRISQRTIVRASPKTGRNDPCPCGSGKKYKQCCGR